MNSSNGKRLRSIHPLYKRLSGDVVWVLLEEYGYDQSQCGQFLDQTIAQMHKILAVMEKVEQVPGLACVYEKWVDKEGTCTVCDCCGFLEGKVVPGTGAAAFAFFPPFGVGCQMGCRVVHGQQALEPGKDLTPLRPEDIPQHSLCCSLLEDAAPQK